MNAAGDSSSPDRFEGFAPSGSTLCPGCDYDLSGLPTAYRCPECGLAYDGDTVVWCGPPNRQYYLVLFSWLFFISFYVFQVVNSQGFIGWRGMLVAMLFTVGSAIIAAKLIRSRGKRSMLALTPDGIIFQSDGISGRERIKWERIHEIEQDVKRHGLATYQFTITYFHLKSIYITPFAKTRDGRYELLAIVEDHRRKRLGLEPR